MTKEQEILKDKILGRIEHNRPRVERFLEQLRTDDNALVDTIVESDEFKFMAADQNLKVKYGVHEASLNKLATKQLATRLGVPTNYINKLGGTTWGTQLAAQILNEHGANQAPQKLLVRKVDQTVRGVLSDQYKRLNSAAVFTAFIVATAAHDGQIYDACYDDNKAYVDVLIPRIQQIETERNGLVDIVFGVQMRKSDFGDGALNVRSYMANVVCLNGMVGHRYLNEIHRGHRIPDSIELSEATMALETQASASTIQDIVNQVFKQESINREVQRIHKASKKLIDPVKKITELKNTKHYTELELEMLHNKILVSRPEDGMQGEKTLWHFVQGMTSMANEIPGDTRKNELIEYASDLY